MVNKKEIYSAVSLGVSCFSAESLRKCGLRFESHPFDWIYSHPQMVIDCLDNNFTNFLDKSQYQGEPSNNFCRHSIYSIDLPIYSHKNPPTFFHHNPLVPRDYDYFTRCVDRFRRFMQRTENKLFLMTYINQSDFLCSDAIWKIQHLKATIDRMSYGAHLVVFNCMSSGQYWNLPSEIKRIDYQDRHVMIVNLITSPIVGTLFTKETDWQLYRSVLDYHYTFINKENLKDHKEIPDPW